MRFNVFNNIKKGIAMKNTGIKTNELDIEFEVLDIKSKDILTEKNIRNKPIYHFIKRIIDILGSLIGIILLSPIFFIVAILIRIESNGPVIFSHERIGQCGIKFKMYKFRSMKSDSAEIFKRFTPEQKKEFEKNFKLEDDPRITQIGDFLRKTSLDELPQLLNIFFGDMTIVGPRPIVEKEIVKYGENASKLFSLKPGLTGFWQANGRSDTTYEERVEMDMYYIDNESLWLDIKIIFQTIAAVVKKKGAV